MKEKMEDIHQSNDKVYDISFRNNTKRFYIKIHNGGSKKGFVMTNPLTIYEHIYPSKYGSSKKNYVLTKLKPFLSEKLEGIKIILVKDNLLRITKYINENEIEEVKYNEPSFNTYIVQEKEFNSFLDLLSKKKKREPGFFTIKQSNIHKN